MPNVSPNIGLHLTDIDDSRNFIDLRLELSGAEEGSNMMILDKEIGKIKNQIIYSTSEPSNQDTGDIWNEIIS